MPSSIDVPEFVGFDMPEGPALYPARPSWFREFLTAPFRDLDGRANWKQKARRQKKYRSVKPYAQA
jgi:hypothetical protein